MRKKIAKSLKPPPAVATPKLDRQPNAPKKSVYAWADYIELLCLFNADQQVSKSDVLDRVRERVEDLGESGGLKDFMGEDFEPDYEDGVAPIIDDKWSAYSEDWFRLLDFRKAFYKSAYPFNLEASDVLSVYDPLSPIQKLYVSLLLSSNLSYFAPQKDILTKSFERLSAETLRALLPETAYVSIFGTSADGSGRYSGNLSTKIQNLSDDLRCRSLLNKKQEDEFSKEYGDNGLDVVAWLPFGDDNNHSAFIILGQCACTDEWVTKQHSSGFESWSRVIAFTAPTNNFCFIPICFRDAQGDWHNPADIKGSILVDRYRFIFLLEGKVGIFEAEDSAKVVDAYLDPNLRESVF